MTEYAKVEDGVVVKVIVADASFIASLPGTWVLTPYNASTGEGKVGIEHTYDGQSFSEPIAAVEPPLEPEI